MVLSCKTIFQEQASKENISKTGLTKIPSFKQAYRFRGIPYVHGGVRISFMHFRFSWSANLGYALWHLKETVAHTGVYRVNALTKLW